MHGKVNWKFVDLGLPDVAYRTKRMRELERASVDVHRLTWLSFITPKTLVAMATVI